MTWVELFLVGWGCGGLSGKKVSQEEIQSKLSQARQGVETFGSTSTTTCSGRRSLFILMTWCGKVWFILPCNNTISEISLWWNFYSITYFEYLLQITFIDILVECACQ